MMRSAYLCSPSALVTAGEATEQETYARYTVDKTEIDSLLLQWQHSTSHPNADIDSYWEVLKHLPNDVSPVVVVAYRQGKPDAALVGRFENGLVNVAVGYKSIAHLRRRQLVLIYRGLLGNGSEQNCKAMMSVISDILRRQLATVAYFNAVDCGSPLYSAIMRAPLLCRDWATQRDIHRSMDLPSTPSAARRSLSPKVRKNLAWQERRLLAAFDSKVSIRCFSRLEELPQLYRDVEQIAATTYQRSLGLGFCDNPVLRARLTVEARKQWLRGYVLYIHGKPTAYWIGKLCRGVFYSDFMGYDPEYAKYSPGMFLIVRVIELLCEPNRQTAAGASKVDFGFGDAQYKTVLGNNEWYEASLRVYSPTMKGALTNLVCSSTAFVNNEIKHLLTQGGILQRVKTRWRRHVLAKHSGSGL